MRLCRQQAGKGSSDLPLPRLQQAVFDHQRHYLRFTEDVLHGPARGDLHLRQLGQGYLGSPAFPRPELPAQDCIRASHKLREALAAEIADKPLEGEIEIDGAYFGGYVRPANFKADRVDRRRVENQNGKRRVVLALRERKGRTHTFVVNSEAEGVAIASSVAREGSVFYADEAAHWDALHSSLVAHRINHSEAYSYYNGVNTNQAESFFSRLRLMVSGQHHHVSAQYLHQYANHAGWLEDHRRNSNGVNAMALLGGALTHPTSNAWAGYWQRNRK